MAGFFCDSAIWTVLLFLIPLLFKVPIGIALGFASITIAYLWDLGIDMTSYNFFASIVKYPLLSVPFFILAGNIMEKASIADKIVNFTQRPPAESRWVVLRLKVAIRLKPAEKTSGLTPAQARD